ncbi:MAG: hypothetical protein KA206_04015 [Paludibacter sp.]|nr:hypothetical protein [Paludibacter sp.]
MLRSTLINRTVNNLAKLPDEKVVEVSDYIEFILKKHEESILQKGIQQLTSNSKTYHFLEEEEDLYTVSDLKEKYNGKG